MSLLTKTYECYICEDLITDDKWKNYADYMIYCKKHEKYSSIGIMLNQIRQHINSIKRELADK